MHGAIHRFDRLPHVGGAPAPELGVSGVPRRKVPLVGLIRNPRSHRNGGRENLPLPNAFGPNIIAHAPARRSELAGILAEFGREQVDYLAIDGGDGTVRDVLTCGAGIFGESWPALIVLPHGKTNALAHDLGIPENWTLESGLEATHRGRVVFRRPVVVTQSENEQAQVYGFVLGGGAFTTAIGLGQDAHDLGAFDAAVVGVTAVWGLLQALFGRRGNPWREGTPMRLTYSDGRELAHAGGGPEDERYLLFASTLESLPGGVRPFGDVQGRLRLAVLDNARRTLLVRMPLIVAGRAGAGTTKLGYHSLGTDALELEIGDRFILDGEAFPPGSYRLSVGPKLRFVVP